MASHWRAHHHHIFLTGCCTSPLSGRSPFCQLRMGENKPNTKLHASQVYHIGTQVNIRLQKNFKCSISNNSIGSIWSSSISFGPSTPVQSASAAPVNGWDVCRETPCYNGQLLVQTYLRNIPTSSWRGIFFAPVLRSSWRWWQSWNEWRPCASNAEKAENQWQNKDNKNRPLARTYYREALEMQSRLPYGEVHHLQREEYDEQHSILWCFKNLYHIGDTKSPRIGSFLAHA